MILLRQTDLNTVPPTSKIRTPGVWQPGVLHVLLLLCLFAGLSAAEAEKPVKNRVFDPDLISTSFATFHLTDPQDESWSLVEDGARVAYRKLELQSTVMRFKTAYGDLTGRALIQQAVLSGSVDQPLSFDSRATELEDFPLRISAHAQSMRVQSSLKENNLAYVLTMQALQQASGQVRFRDGNWYPFSLQAENMSGSLVLRSHDGHLSEPDLRRCRAAGVSAFHVLLPATAERPRRCLRIRAGELMLRFQPGLGCESIRLTGSLSVPARLQVLSEGELKTYTASSIQVLLGTGSVLRQLRCSSDVSLRSTRADEAVHACVDRHQD